MKYSVEIYNNSPDNKARFVLGTKGLNPLFVLGLNPSTADENKPDMTIPKTMTFAKNAGFDSFVMLNLYAQRTPVPENVDKTLNKLLHQENIEKIGELLSNYKKCSILSAWGETINIRPFFSKCLKDINDSINHLDIEWLKIGSLTQSGHPRHPSRAAYKYGLTKFDLKYYLKEQLNEPIYTTGI